MSSRYSFYIENRGVKYMFDNLEELKDYTDMNNYNVEAYEIRLGDHCDSLTDDEYDAFSKMKIITDYHLKLFEEKELFEFQC